MAMHIYLTVIIPQVCIGCDMIDSQQGMQQVQVE